MFDTRIGRICQFASASVVQISGACDNKHKSTTQVARMVASGTLKFYISVLLTEANNYPPIDKCRAILPTHYCWRDVIT